MKFTVLGSLTLASVLAGGTVGLAKSGSMVSVPMHAQNGSGQNGTATLQQQGPNLVVTISVTNGSSTPQPAHIHDGPCAHLNPAPEYPLSNVVNGRSTTTLKNVSLAKLEAAPYAINVHKSAAELKVYTSCGDIPKKSMK